MTPLFKHNWEHLMELEGVPESQRADLTAQVEDDLKRPPPPGSEATQVGPMEYVLPNGERVKLVTNRHVKRVIEELIRQRDEAWFVIYGIGATLAFIAFIAGLFVGLS